MTNATGGSVVPYDLGKLEDYDQARALNLREARKLILNHKREPVHADKLRKWASKGCWPRGKNGPWLVLPTLKVSGINMTMPSWVEAFKIARLRLSKREPSVPLERPARRRAASIKLAEETLDRAGIGKSKSKK